MSKRTAKSPTPSPASSSDLDLEQVKRVCAEHSSVEEQAKALGLSTRAWQLRRIGLLSAGLIPKANGKAPAVLSEGGKTTTTATSASKKRKDTPSSTVPLGVLRALGVKPGDSLEWTMGRGTASVKAA